MQTQKPSIWVDSSLSINYPLRSASLDRSKRFQFDSIYYKDDPSKPKKKVDEFMFPHELLIRFRKSIRDASKSKSRQKLNQLRKKSQEDEQPYDTIQLRASQITQKLYEKPIDKVRQERDLFGNRTSLHQKQLSQICKLPIISHQQSQRQHKSNQKLYITGSQRIDLSRPINFNPGPGSYLFKDSLDQFKNQLSKSRMSIETQNKVLKKKTRENLPHTNIDDNNH